MLTVWVRRTPQHAFCQGVLLGCFAIFPFDFCSCLFIFCFRPLSLSFLPLSPIASLLFPLSLIFSPLGQSIILLTGIQDLYLFSLPTYQGQRWFKCNLILVHLSATPLDNTVNSGTLHLNLNSLLWHQPIYHYVINLSVILASRCILLLPFGNVNFCLNRYPR